MFRPGPTLPAQPASPAWRRRRRARAVCASSLAAATVLYLASPFMTLWTLGAALQVHDDSALRSSLDWKLVRAGLKQSLGLEHAVRQASQQDELPGFGESFAVGVASGMIDEDITPQRLDAMLSTPALHKHGMANLPRGFFTGPSCFVAEIRMGAAAPIDLTLRIEKWHWKVTRVTLPQEMLTPPAITRVAATTG